MEKPGGTGAGQDVEVFDDRIAARALNELPDAVLVVDALGSVVWGNRAAELMFDREIRDSVGFPGLELVHPEDLQFVMLALLSVQDKDRGSPIEVRLKTPGGWRLIELIGAPATWLVAGAVILVLRDLTERRRFELAGNQDAQFRSIMQNSAAVTMLVSPDGVVGSSSGALTRLLGHDPEVIIGAPLSRIVEDADRATLAQAFDRARSGASAAHPEVVVVRLQRIGGEESLPFELAIVNLVDDPTVGGFVVSARDMTEQKRLEDRLMYQAFHDSLTGLGNRSLFLDRMTNAVARAERTHGQLAVFYLDVDNFKVINDSLGHSGGDTLLQAIGGILVSCLRKRDTPARIGGDEFGVIVEEFTDRQEVFAVAERILEAARQPLTIADRRVVATVSIGITFYLWGTSSDQLLSDADLAMYSAKQSGKDRIAVGNGASPYPVAHPT